MSHNEHTGAELKTKPASDAYRDGYDRIFGKGPWPTEVVHIGMDFSRDDPIDLSKYPTVPYAKYVPEDEGI